MHKPLATIAAAIAMAAASAASHAADTVNGAFFVNGNLGQSQYRVALADGYGVHSDKKDTTYAARFGYVWYNTVDFGVEGGYVDLGEASVSYNDGVTRLRGRLSSKALLAGVNGKYHFGGNHWYVAARGGYLRTRATSHGSYSEPGYYTYGSSTYNGNGWYAGASVGYDFTPNFGLGLHYDNYRVKLDSYDGLSRSRVNVATFSLGAEYRF